MYFLWFALYRYLIDWSCSGVTGKVSVPTFINGPEIISSSSDKAKLFASNTALDNKGHPFPDFLVSVLFLIQNGKTQWIKRLDPKKDTASDKMSVIKNINLQLSLILAKLFNSCLKDKSFQSP